GNRQNSGSSALDGLQSDLWVGTIATICNPANSPAGPPPCTAVGAAQQLQISWSQVTVAGTPPSKRSGSKMTFGGDYAHLVIYGGTDATGPLGDLWDIDFNAATPTWRQLPLPPAALTAVSPGARTGGVLVGSSNSAFVY